MRDILLEIWSSLQRNKLRTALTGFAVSWGIFMLIVLLGAGKGLMNGLSASNDMYMVNSMIVSGGRTTLPYDGLKEGRTIELDMKDVELTAGSRFADHVDEVTPSLNTSTMTLSHDSHYLSITLTAVYPAFGEIQKVKMLHGRFINQPDINGRRKVIVLSEAAAGQLNGGASAAGLLGKHIKVSGMMFSVVGIYKTDETQFESPVYVPYTTAQLLQACGDKVSDVYFSFHDLPDMAGNEAFEAGYLAAINANHRADPTDRGALLLWNRFKQNLMMNTAMSMLQMALWIIGILTLISGIVGVSNIMLISVKERTHEFGIRKAIGAAPGSLLKMIIAESVAITAIFGYIGMVLGMLACELMDKTLGRTSMESMFGADMKIFSDPFVGVDVAIGATVLLIVAGVTAGFFPAWKAAKVRPIEALRVE